MSHQSLWQSREMRSASCPSAMCQRTVRLQHFFKIPVSAQGKLQVHANSKQKLSDHGNMGGKIQAEAFRSQQPGKEGTGSHSARSRSAAAIAARPRPAKWPGFGDCCEEEAYFPFFSLSNVGVIHDIWSKLLLNFSLVRKSSFSH